MKLGGDQETPVEVEGGEDTTEAPTSSSSSPSPSSTTPAMPTSFTFDDDLMEDGIPRYNNPLTAFPKHIFEGLEEEEPVDIEAEIVGPPITKY